jgi:hypothetical protein
LTENNIIPPKYQEGLFTAISVGFGLLLVGALFVVTPNLFDKIINFFKDFKLVDVPNTSIIFPAPGNPGSHSVVYQAAGQFSIAVTILQVILLVLRFVIPSSLSKKSENISNLVYWAGTSFLFQEFLIDNSHVTLTNWFEFWCLIIVLAGVSLLARAAFMAVSRIQQ